MWLQKAISVNSNSAEAHFELASFATYFEIEEINSVAHYKKAIELKPSNYIYKLALAYVQEQFASVEPIDNVLKTLINPPENCLTIFMNWQEEYYLALKDRFYTVNPHEMTCVSK